MRLSLKAESVTSVDSTLLTRWLTWLMILAGTGLRLTQYAYNRSLTGDESALAVNIINRSYNELLQPLDFQQAAPVGFLFLQRFVIDLLGTSEYALRLVPLLAGIGALFLLYYTARLILSPIAAVLALGLFALYSDLIYYAAEAKQYSTDVFITLALTTVGIYVLQKRLTPLLALCFAAAGAIAVWFSHPALFTLAGLGLTLLVTSWRTGDRRRALMLILVGGVWISSFALLYLLNLRFVSSNSYLTDFWARGFMPLPPRTLTDALWLPIRFIDTFRTAFLFPLPGIAALAFLIGSFTLYLRHRIHLSLLLLPAFFTLLAACLRQYPFLGRMILFLAPALIILMAEGADRLRLALARTYATNVSPRTLGAIGIVFIILLFANPLMITMPILQAPLTFGTAGEEGRLALEYLVRNRQPDDLIYAYRPFEEPLLYYRERYGLTDDDYIVGGNHRANWTGYFADMDALPRAPRVWLLFTHVYQSAGADERLLILNYLDMIGAEPLDSFAGDGAWAYLYDFSSARQLVNASDAP